MVRPVATSLDPETFLRRLDSRAFVGVNKRTQLLKFLDIPPRTLHTVKYTVKIHSPVNTRVYTVEYTADTPFFSSPSYARYQCVRALPRIILYYCEFPHLQRFMWSSKCVVALEEFSPDDHSDLLRSSFVGSSILSLLELEVVALLALGKEDEERSPSCLCETTEAVKIFASSGESMLNQLPCVSTKNSELWCKSSLTLRRLESSLSTQLSSETPPLLSWDVEGLSSKSLTIFK